MKKLVHKKWICPVLVLGLFIVLTIVLYLLGFRITYAPNLENGWNAISAVAAWAGVVVAAISAIASFLAVWFAIRVPQKIAKQQNKIQLFDKRFRIYKLLLCCKAFALTIKDIKNKTELRKLFLMNFFDDTFKKPEECDLNDFQVYYLRVLYDLSTSEFLFPKEVSITLLFLAKRLSALVDIFPEESDDVSLIKSKDDYFAMCSQLEKPLKIIEQYLDLEK